MVQTKPPHKNKQATYWTARLLKTATRHVYIYIHNYLYIVVPYFLSKKSLPDLPPFPFQPFMVRPAQRSFAVQQNRRLLQGDLVTVPNLRRDVPAEVENRRSLRDANTFLGYPMKVVIYNYIYIYIRFEF